MLSTKFDLYKAEWLDLVFKNRNQSYGAYELRRHYAQNMLKSMGIAFFGVGVIIGAGVLIARPVIQPIISVINNHETIVDLTTVIPPVDPVKPITPPVKTHTVTPPAAASHVKTTAIPTTVAPDNFHTVDPPKIEEIQGAIGPVSTQGPATAENTPSGGATNGKGEGSGTGNGEDISVHDFRALEAMPEPMGGAAAWTKFLQKNLRYPEQALDQNVNGRVLISFIIEKDGHLSNIQVDRSAGFGFDEEALRVLKLAAAWKPGIQNGRPVRVKYTIPINFRLPD